MSRTAVSIVLLAAAVLLPACHCFKHNDCATSAMALDHGYALLYSTIDAESQVDQVLVIKDPDPQVAELIKAIARFAGDTKDRLRAFAEEDATLGLDNEGLPEVEARTRAAISSATAKQILFSGGKEFEFSILLTQHEALNYITNLAGTLSEQDTREDRKRFLAQLAEQSNAMHERVIAQLQAPYVGQESR